MPAALVADAPDGIDPAVWARLLTAVSLGTDTDIVTADGASGSSNGGATLDATSDQESGGTAGMPSTATGNETTPQLADSGMTGSTNPTSPTTPTQPNLPPGPPTIPPLAIPTPTQMTPADQAAIAMWRSSIVRMGVEIKDLEISIKKHEVEMVVQGDLVKRLQGDKAIIETRLATAKQNNDNVAQSVYLTAIDLLKNQIAREEQVYDGFKMERDHDKAEIAGRDLGILRAYAEIGKILVKYYLQGRNN